MHAKRQQVIHVMWALATGPSGTARLRLRDEVPGTFVTGVKRVLEFDLRWGRENPDLLKQYGMAFYDELPSGTGSDVAYSPLRVFNLALALELVRFGGKQGEVVDLIAQLQSKLKVSFDQSNGHQDSAERTKIIRHRDASGETSTKELHKSKQIFLVLRRIEVTKRGENLTGGKLISGQAAYDAEFLYGSKELNEYILTNLANRTYSLLIVEISELAVRVVELLRDAPMRKRGRISTRVVSSETPSNVDDFLEQIRVRERTYGR